MWWDTINTAFLTIADPVFGWMLRLPRDVTLFIVAVGTATILTVVRVFTTDQKFLKQVKADKARLKKLIREAKRGKDKEALARYRATFAQAGTKAIKYEGLPLLVAVLLILPLATWCFSRIVYLPPQAGEPVTVRAYFPVKAIDKLVHIMPQEGVAADSGWIQKVVKDVDPATGEVANGVAIWKLRCQKRKEPYALQFSFAGKVFEKELVVDGVRYAAREGTIQFYPNDSLTAVEVVLPQCKLFGVVPDLATVGGWLWSLPVLSWLGWLIGQVPGLGQANLDPWLMGYVIIVVPFSFLLKPLLRIC